MKHLQQTTAGWRKHVRIKGTLYTHHTKDRPSRDAVAAWVRKMGGKAEEERPVSDDDTH